MMHVASALFKRKFFARNFTLLHFSRLEYSLDKDLVLITQIRPKLLRLAKKGRIPTCLSSLDTAQFFGFMIL